MGFVLKLVIESSSWHTLFFWDQWLSALPVHWNHRGNLKTYWYLLFHPGGTDLIGLGSTQVLSTLYVSNAKPRWRTTTLWFNNPQGYWSSSKSLTWLSVRSEIWPLLPSHSLFLVPQQHFSSGQSSNLHSVLMLDKHHVPLLEHSSPTSSPGHCLPSLVGVEVSRPSGECFWPSRLTLILKQISRPRLTPYLFIMETGEASRTRILSSSFSAASPVPSMVSGT